MSAPLGLADHPDIIDLGSDFIVACYRAFDYCAAQRSDGRMPRGIASRIFGALLADAKRIGLLVDGDNCLLLQQFLDTNLRAEQRRDSSTDSSAVGSTDSPTGCKEKEKENQKETKTMPPAGAGAAAPPRSTPPTKPPRQKRAAHPNRQAYLADFHEAHKAASGGGTYSWSGRELVALDGCCADYPPDRWKAACASLAARRPEWLFRNGETPDLGAFRRNFNAFAAAAALPTTGRPASTTRPGHADPFDFIRIGQEMERDGLFQVRDRAACPERGASPDFDAGR